MIIVRILLLALLLRPNVASAQTLNDPLGPAQLPFEQSVVAATRFDWRSSVALLEKARKLAPTHPRIHFALALSHEQLGNDVLTAFWLMAYVQRLQDLAPNQVSAVARFGAAVARVKERSNTLLTEAAAIAMRLPNLPPDDKGLRPASDAKRALVSRILGDMVAARNLIAAERLARAAPVGATMGLARGAGIYMQKFRDNGHSAQVLNLAARIAPIEAAIPTLSYAKRRFPFAFAPCQVGERCVSYHSYDSQWASPAHRVSENSGALMLGLAGWARYVLLDATAREFLARSEASGYRPGEYAYSLPDLPNDASIERNTDALGEVKPGLVLQTPNSGIIRFSNGPNRELNHTYTWIEVWKVLQFGGISTGWGSEFIDLDDPLLADLAGYVHTFRDRSDSEAATALSEAGRRLSQVIDRIGFVITNSGRGER